MSTPPHVLQVREKVQRLLTDAVGNVGIDKDGDFTFQFGSARIFIGVHPHGDEATVITFLMPLLNNVPPSPELFEYVAKEGSYTWGHLTVWESKDGSHYVEYRHALLGDFLDADELHAAVGAMVNTGDDLDNQLQAKFGGDLFHPDAEA